MKKNLGEEKRRFILTGNIWKVVIAITLPLFLYKFIDSFYNLLDQIMVANIGSGAVSAVATIYQIKSLISSLGMALASGGGILIARYYGKGDIDKAKKIANITFTLALIIIAILLAVCLPFSKQILIISQVPDDLIAISTSYFMLQIIEQGIIVINNLFIAMEKSKGNTRIIFIANLLIMGIKLSLNSLFIYGFKVDDIIWIEVASIISQSSMMAIGLYYLFRKKNIFRIEFKSLSLNRKDVFNILKLSFPIFLGKFVFSFGKVSVNAMCKQYGSLTVGALGISNNISGMISNSSSSFEDSQSSIVSQNLGNRNMKRCFKIFLVSFALVMIWTTFGYIFVRFLFQDQIINLFNTKNTSPVFTQMIKDIFFYDSFSIIALAFSDVVLGLLYGFGQTIYSTVINVIRILTRILTLWILQTYFPQIGAEAAGISMGISNGIIAAITIIAFIIFFIKIKVKGYKGMKLSDKEPEMIEVDGILVRKEEVDAANN